MTIDEAIEHAEKVAEVQEEAAKEWHENQVRKCELIPFAEMDYTHENECKKCAAEYRQLAEWLTDYKNLLLAIEEIKSLGKSRRILLIKGDEVLSLVKDIIDEHTSGKEGK